MGYEGLRFLSARKEDSEAKGGCIFYFDKKEKYQNTATYQVTSWDEVIEHFIDEIEEM